MLVPYSSFFSPAQGIGSADEELKKKLPNGDKTATTAELAK